MFPCFFSKDNHQKASNLSLKNQVELKEFSTYEIKEILSEEIHLTGQTLPQKQFEHWIFDYKVHQVELTTLLKFENNFTQTAKMKLNVITQLNEDKLALVFVSEEEGVFVKQLIQIYDLKKNIVAISFSEEFPTKNLIRAFSVSDNDIAIIFNKKPYTLTIFCLSSGIQLSEIELSNWSFLSGFSGQFIASINRKSSSYIIKVWNYHTQKLIREIDFPEKRSSIKSCHPFQTYKLVIFTNIAIYLFNVLSMSLEKMNLFQEYDIDFDGHVLLDRYICATTSKWLWQRTKHILLIHDTHLNRCYELDTKNQVKMIRSINDEIGAICYTDSMHYWDLSELKNLPVDSKQIKIGGLQEKDMLTNEYPRRDSTFNISQQGNIFFYNEELLRLIKPHRACDKKIHNDLAFSDCEVITFKQ